MRETMREKLAKIRLLLLDVDGILTDGRIYFADNGMESKAFYARDGHGIKLLLRSGIRVGLLTGRSSHLVELRARDLGIDLVFQGAKEKLPVFRQILQDLHLRAEEVAYMGDDVVDLPVLMHAGVAATVADCSEEIRPVVDFVSRYRGGLGAVREFCELLLKSTGRWEEIMADYTRKGLECL